MSQFQRISKRMRILILILVIVFGGLVAFNVVKGYMVGKFLANFHMPPVTVSTVEAKLEDWALTLEAVGDFVAIQGVDINAQATGVVKSITFESGEYVKKGTPLIVIDDSVEQATLSSSQANLVLQKSDFERQVRLLKTGSTSGAQMDTARANLDSATATVQQIQATINQKHIVAPFDGKLGIRQVSLGEYITPGQTSIVTLQSLNPLYLQFYLPEQNFSALYLKQPIRFTVDGFSGESFTGEITATNAKIDTSTHNILVQATVQNELRQGQYIFVPGMFANIEVLLPQQKKVIVLPLTAVTYTLYGDSVYVVKKTGKDKKNPVLKVYRQFVKVGEKKANQVMILEGLKAGDQVVNAGQMKVHNGTQVVINNSILLPSVQNVDTLGE